MKVWKGESMEEDGVVWRGELRRVKMWMELVWIRINAFMWVCRGGCVGKGA